MRKLSFLPLRGFMVPTLLALVSIALELAGSEMRDLLRYDRLSLAGGEWWRLVTAHNVHLGWSHLWLNLAGLALIWLLIGNAFSAKGWMVVFLICSAATSVALYLFSPSVGWYVGLSGVLHGLLVAGAIVSRQQFREAPWLLALVAAKLAWEQFAGPMPGSEGAAGGTVVVDAHLYGALSGAVIAVTMLGLRRTRSRQVEKSI